MSFRIILLKKRHKVSEHYFIRDILEFKDKKDLTGFKKQPFKLIFRFEVGKSTFIDQQDDKIIKQNLRLFLNPQKEIESKIDLTDTQLAEVVFQVPAHKVEDFINSGYFYLLELPPPLFSVPGCKFSLQDHTGKEHLLSEIDLCAPTTKRNGFYTYFESNDTVHYTTNPLYFDPCIKSDGLYWQSEKQLHQPPGTIVTYDSLPLKFHVTIENFRPDEHIAFVTRTVDNRISSYTLVPPSVIQSKLASDKKINFLDIRNQLAPVIGRLGHQRRYPNPRYDKLFLPLPSLFSGDSEFEMIQVSKDYSKKEKRIKYSHNPTKTFEIHINKEAQSAWFNHKTSLSSQKKTNQELLAESRDINCFITQIEHASLHFKHDPNKDILGEGTIRRDVYWDEHFIHLSTLSHNIPKATTLYEALPEELQSRFFNKQFCFIQYNASKTVPKHPDAKPGYSVFNDQPLKPGYIYRNFLSLDDLKKVDLHSGYGGSYYVLAVCTPGYMRGDATQPAPELWTIYTEGAPWTSLKNDKGELVAFPYKINY